MTQTIFYSRSGSNTSFVIDKTYATDVVNIPYTNRKAVKPIKITQEKPAKRDPVQCASEDSFPASDPPSWTRTIVK